MDDLAPRKVAIQNEPGALAAIKGCATGDSQPELKSRKQEAVSAA
jgi:hypothetical protein